MKRWELKFSSLAIVCGWLISGTAISGANVVIIDGKPFTTSFEEVELKKCPLDQPSGSNWMDLRTTTRIMYDTSVLFLWGACLAGCGDSDECIQKWDGDPEIAKRKHRATQKVFDSFRPYPSRFRSATCAEARDVICRDLCISAIGFKVLSQL